MKNTKTKVLRAIAAVLYVATDKRLAGQYLEDLAELGDKLATSAFRFRHRGRIAAILDPMPAAIAWHANNREPCETCGARCPVHTPHRALTRFESDAASDVASEPGYAVAYAMNEGPSETDQRLHVKPPWTGP